MDTMQGYLQSLASNSGSVLFLEPNKQPFLSGSTGEIQLNSTPIQGSQISMMVFPLLSPEAKKELPNKSEVTFNYRAGSNEFNFNVKKTPNGFSVSVKNISGNSQNSFQTNSSTNQNSFSSPQSFQSQPEVRPQSVQNNFSTGTNLTQSQPFASVNNTNFNANQTQPNQSSAPNYAEIIADINLKEESKPQNEPKTESVPVKTENTAFNQSTVNSGKSKTERIDRLFRHMAEIGASDLHLSVSMPPMVRKDGRIQELPCHEKDITIEVMKELLWSIMPEKNKAEFEEKHDTDFAYEIEGLARFRSNIFMDRKGPGAVFRIIPSKILTSEQLGLSEAILKLCTLSKGLVVVTGPTGSGKSTTLCAMVDHINRNRDEHLITIEDPIEFVHENKKCLINQREVHNHTDSFKNALRAALREDPDIVLVGEMRDLETISIAIETAETGHLVFGTLHTSTAASTVDRIIDQFPPDRQQQIRVMLSESLRGVIAQTLLPKKGGGRIAALEILIVTPAISNLIREGKTFQIASAMQTGKNQGMVLLNEALLDLVKKGLVEPKDAYIKAVDKTGLEMLFERNAIKM